MALALFPNAILLLVYQALIRSGVYYDNPWLDNPLHILGGGGLAWAFFVSWRLARKRLRFPLLPYWAAVFFAVGTAATIGIIWEQYEFVWDLGHSGGWLTPSVSDFIKDLTNDLLGAFIFSVLAAEKFFSRRDRKPFKALD